MKVFRAVLGFVGTVDQFIAAHAKHVPAPELDITRFRRPPEQFVERTVSEIGPAPPDKRTVQQRTPAPPPPSLADHLRNKKRT